MILRYLFFALFGLFFSCQEDSLESELINCIVDVSNSKDVLLSELTSSIVYTPLTSSVDYYLFNNWIDARIVQDRLYIHQDGGVYDNFFAFGLDGNLDRMITSPGESIGKIANGSDYFVHGDTLVVLDSYAQSLVSFLWSDGRHLGTDKLPYPYKKFVRTAAGYLFYMRNQLEAADTSMHYNFFLTGNDYKPGGRYFRIPKYLENYRVKEYNFSNEVDGEVLIKNFLSKEIWLLSSSGLSQKYNLDFGNEWVDESVYSRLSVDNSRAARRKLLYDRQDHIYEVTHLFHNSAFIFSTFRWNGDFYWAFIKKDNGDVKLIRRIENDIDGSPLGKKEYWPIDLVGNELYFLVPTEEFKYYFKFLKEGEEEAKSLPGYQDYAEIMEEMPVSASAMLVKINLRKLNW